MHTELRKIAKKINIFLFSLISSFQNSVTKNKIIITKKEYYLVPYYAQAASAYSHRHAKNKIEYSTYCTRASMTIINSITFPKGYVAILFNPPIGFAIVSCRSARVLCSLAIKMFEQLIMNSFNTKSKK